MTMDARKQRVLQAIVALYGLEGEPVGSSVRPMKQCLILEMGLPYINFKTIGDYIILICYFLKLLKVSKTEIKAFIREFEKITKEYEEQVSSEVAAITVHPDLFSRMTILKNSI